MAALTLGATQDTTLIQDADGALANGGGQHFFAGRTSQPITRSGRRGLIQFDLSDPQLVDRPIAAVSLRLHMSRAIVPGHDVSLHPVSDAWSEGTADAEGNEGRGAPADANSATWLHRSFDESAWVNPGGDFGPASATTQISTSGFYTWSSDELTADVQKWIQSPDENFGWAVLGDESLDSTSKRFDSREHPDESRRPQLTIHFASASVSATTASVPENKADTDAAVFHITLSTQLSVATTIRYQTQSGSATAGEDFVDTNGTLTFLPDSPLTQQVAVPLINDEQSESNEDFRLILTEADGVFIDEAIATITIVDDDTRFEWQNAELPFDVDGDGRLLPLDALSLINELNGVGIGLSTGPLPAVSDTLRPSPFVDVSGDNSFTAFDALLVINELNRVEVTAADDASNAESPATHDSPDTPEGEASVTIGVPSLRTDLALASWLEDTDDADRARLRHRSRRR